MRDLGVMTFKAADEYKFLFDQQEIVCEIRETHPLLSVLIGGGWGNNKRVNLLVRDEDYSKAQVLFTQQEKINAQRVEELTPAANQSMAIIGLVLMVAVVLFYLWFYN